MFASNNQDNKSVRHLESQLFLCFNFFCSSPCFYHMSGHRASPLIHRLRSVPLWTWRHVRWVDQSKTCQWRPRLESERHHCIKKNISIMNWTRTTIFVLYFIDSVKSQIYPSASNDLGVIAREGIIPSITVPEVCFLFSSTTASRHVFAITRLTFDLKTKKRKLQNPAQ